MGEKDLRRLIGIGLLTGLVAIVLAPAVAQAGWGASCDGTWQMTTGVPKCEVTPPGGSNTCSGDVVVCVIPQDAPGAFLKSDARGLHGEVEVKSYARDFGVAGTVHLDCIEFYAKMKPGWGVRSDTSCLPLEEAGFTYQETVLSESDTVWSPYGHPDGDKVVVDKCEVEVRVEVSGNGYSNSFPAACP